MIRTATRRLGAAPLTEAGTEGGEVVTLYHLAEKGKATKYLQGTDDILTTGFREEHYTETAPSGKQSRVQGVILQDVPNSCMCCVEVRVTLTEEEMQRFFGRPYLDKRRSKDFKPEDFVICDDGTAHIHIAGGCVNIPADILNSRAQIRVLTLEESERLTQERWDADAEEYERMKRQGGDEADGYRT